MQFDIFHSIGRIDSVSPQLNDRQVFEAFFKQVKAAENLNYDTMWVAESHFSSEVQKHHKHPVIPNYQGEVGLNCDTMQLFAFLLNQTSKLNFGSAIFNIVGGNGGPIASADRVRTLAFLNGLQAHPRTLNIGVAAGRFPYINAPFGVVPRNAAEESEWETYKRFIFLEALEIFLRLSMGETIGSQDVTAYRNVIEDKAYKSRWEFEPLRLVPELDADAAGKLKFVLGSHDPWARDLGFGICDMDVFNLSFTPPEQLNRIHAELTTKCQQAGTNAWGRQRLPRTVLIFIDKSEEKAKARASACFDTYIEAMKGTAQVPDKAVLLTRALIGTPEQICEQLSTTNPRQFHKDDRLMLWFEFNQSRGDDIIEQMQLFGEKVAPHYR
jgi:alkanesulfonate monooxygenase SsuD/methylene tetrahydromethanopterin reductase-like flavin-dependent oxidoreductase (luciferase family)